MAKTGMMILALAAAAWAASAEEEAIQLKVYVEGMSCPTECAPKVAKVLSSLEGARDVKLVDFDKGLFSLSIDAKSALKPTQLQKSLGAYKVKKIEGTLVGTLSAKDKETFLTGAGGAKYAVFVDADAACCDDAKGEAKKGAEKPEADECPAIAALKAKLQALAKDGKRVKVTGIVSECCEVNVAVLAIEELKQPAN